MVDNIPAVEQFLRRLRASEAPLSGERLSRELGISRSALWKHVRSLRGLGYRIEAAPRVGYRLAAAPDVAYPWEVRAGLKAKRLGQQAHFFEETGSTQDEARRLAEAGAPEGTLAVAERLSAARGRMGRGYVTPPGGLWFSLLLRPRRAPKEVILLSLLAAVGVHRAIEQATGLRPTVRWPNDLLLDGRKITGILIELESEQDVLRHAIIGIGVNVNVRPADFPPEVRPIATSLSAALGRDVPRVPLLRGIMEHMEELYDRYLADGPAAVLDAWRALPTILGQRVAVEDLRERWRGTAEEIDGEGALLVRTAGGELRRVLAGDVRIMT